MKQVLTLVMLFVAVGCAGNSKSSVEEKNPFDPITLKENLIVGKTAQTDVLKTFGSPGQVSQDASGKEVWMYSMKSHERSRDSMSAGVSVYNWTRNWSGLVIPSINGGHSEVKSGSRSVDLMLEFDKKKVLKDYRLSKSAY